MRFSEDTIFSSEVVNNETTLSEAVSLEHLFGFSVYASWSGTTITGSIKLLASVDGTNYEDIAASSVAITATGSNLWNIIDTMYKFFKVSVTSDDANDITVTASFYAKGF